MGGFSRPFTSQLLGRALPFIPALLLVLAACSSEKVPTSVDGFEYLEDQPQAQLRSADATATIGDTILLNTRGSVAVSLAGLDPLVLTRSRIASQSGAFSVFVSRAKDFVQLNARSTQASDRLVLTLGSRTISSPVWIIHPDSIRSLEIVGVPDTIVAGQRFSLSAVVTTDRFGKLRTQQGLWSASGGAAASFVKDELVASGAGTFDVTVNLLGRMQTRRLIVRSPATSGIIAGLASTLTVGQSTTISAAFRNAEGQPVQCGSISWAASPTGIAIVSPVSAAGARLTGIAAGAATVQAICDGSVIASQPVQITAASTRSISLGIRQLDTNIAGDSIFVSSGVPLAPGVLRAGGVPSVRLLVNGIEVRRHASALFGTHRDGTLRAILVQFTVPKSAVSNPVTLELTGRTLSELPRTAPNGEPAAIVQYTNLSDLIATNIVGRTRPRAQTPSSPSFFQLYEQNFDRYEPLLSNSGETAAAQNFYDRVLAQYGFWARTGNPVLFARASNLARRYRDDYIVKSNYGIPEWQAGIDGLAVHYWLTGDDSTRNVILRVASNIEFFRGSTAAMTNPSHPWMDARIYARVLMAKVLSVMLGASSLPATPAAVPDLVSAARTDLNDILAMQQSDGSWRFVSQCGQASNFTMGLLIGVLGQYHDNVDEDARIQPSIQKAVDFLHTTQWRATDLGFNYYSGFCEGHGSVTAAPDLNGLFLDGIGWLYRRTGKPELRILGDELLRGSATKAFVSSGKQFNQTYQMSFRWLGER